MSEPYDAEVERAMMLGLNVAEHLSDCTTVRDTADRQSTQAEVDLAVVKTFLDAVRVGAGKLPPLTACQWMREEGVELWP